MSDDDLKCVGFFVTKKGAKRDDYTSGIVLARNFYAAHELSIARAACEKKAEDRHFDYSAEQFDDWAVAEGFMPKRVRDAAGVEADGLARMREKLRSRLNRVARRGDGLARGFSVEARAKRWRVALSEQYVGAQPTAMMDGLSRHYDRLSANIEYVKDQARRQEHLNELERQAVLAQVDQANLSIFWGVQQVQMALHRMNPHAQIPDMRKLRRGMSKIVSDAFTPLPQKAQPAQKRLGGV